MCYCIKPMPKHSRIVAITSAMPYEGRDWVRATYHEGRDAAEDGDARTCLEKAAAIDHFANRHRLQTVAAFAMAAANAAVAYTGHDSNWFSAAYDTAYGLANAGVVWTQRLLARQLIEKVPEVQRTIEIDAPTQQPDLEAGIGP